MTGKIFDIKRFALHDGRGIRSTLFLKGCPLNCPWCQNPEGRDSSINLHYFSSKCIGCGTCESVCPKKAIKYHGQFPHVHIDKTLCDNCGICVENCPAQALSFDGKIISEEVAVQELLKDELFYQTSGGGVTLSGGEPLFQPEFSLKILQQCREKGIHTAVETCLAVPLDNIIPVIDFTNKFIVDIKIYDSEKHCAVTGKDNKQIFSNLEYLAKHDAELLIRIPLIPGFTATEKNILAIGRYISSISENIPVELINYNPLAENKFRLLNLEYCVEKNTLPYTAEQLDLFRSILKKTGLSEII